MKQAVTRLFDHNSIDTEKKASRAMKKYRLIDDYSEGCHPRILEALASTNTEQAKPYGDDEHSDRAKRLIRGRLRDPKTAIYFVAGGTLANIVIAASTLRNHESIIAADCGHIVGSEAGAIEAIGHQIITLPNVNGKLTPNGVESVLEDLRHSPFATRPRMVYISNATELGTVYDAVELAALSKVCQANELLLWLDGARLAAALAGPRELTLADIEKYTDVFWLGGTKSGALLGEAIIIPNHDIAVDFAIHLKQRGAILSKGRVFGLQFAELFNNNLIFELAQHACKQAMTLSAAIENAGHRLFVETEANLVFAILPDDLITRLNERFELYVWKPLGDGQSLVRLATSWATNSEQVDQFVELIAKS